MRTIREQLNKNEKIKLDGLAIIIDGSVEKIIDGKPVETKKFGNIGYELLFNTVHMIELRALEDHTVLAILPLVELKKSYSESADIKAMADKKCEELISELYGLVTSKEHFSFTQVIEKLVKTGAGSYTVLNITQLCEEWEYSRTQFYRAVKALEEKGIKFNRKTKTFSKK